MRIVFASRICLGVHFNDCVIGAVYIKVQTEIEEVLMMYSFDFGRDLVSVSVVVQVIFVFLNASRSHDACELNFHLQHAVLMENPVKAVFVIADGGYPGEY